MLRRLFLIALLLAVVGGVAFWLLTAPTRVADERVAAIGAAEANEERGRRIFLIGGCASCHAAKDAKDDQRLVLLGGRQFKTEFGTFIAPNITPDTSHGIGGWSREDFANAMLRGVSPAGEHYYPAFPYASYARMSDQDIADLWAYLRTLPADARPNDPHALGFPFSIRRGLGLWKLFAQPDPTTPIAAHDGPGRYLVEGPGHCGECHTSRNAMGGLDLSQWLAGAPSPEGEGRVPNITPGGKDTSGWTEGDIAEYLKSGFTPDYDTAGGSMVDVIANTSKLSDEDRAAIAAYLVSLPAREGD